MPFLLALALAIVLTPAAARAAIRLGLVDRPLVGATHGELKIHDRPVAVLGGAAVAVAALGAVAILGPRPSAWLSAAVLTALVVGLLDDLRSLPPSVRVLLLLLAGVALALGGARVPSMGPFSIAAVVLLAPALAFGVNLVDGQDGLAGGLTGLAALGLAGIEVSSGTQIHGSAGFGLALAGALVAFVIWNRPPARIFLGDGGAYALGIMLTSLTASTAAARGWKGILAAAVCLQPFGFELAFTVVRRLGSGVALTQGDRRHSYDLLSRATGSRWRSTVLCWGVGAVSAGLAVCVARLPAAAGVALAAGSVLSFAAAAWLLVRREGLGIEP